MITPMKKVFIAARQDDRDALLDALGTLGVLHIEPVDPAQAVAEERTLMLIDHAGRALQILDAHTHDAPAGEPPALTADEAVEEVLRIQRQQSERHNRLLTLHRHVEELAAWGDLRLEQLDALATAGLTLTFATLPAADLDTIEAEFVSPIGSLRKKDTLVALVTRDGAAATLPESAETVERPAADRPTLQAEAQAIETALEHDVHELTQLVAYSDAIAAHLESLKGLAEYTAATRSGAGNEHLLALKGWVPAKVADGLAGKLADQGLHAAIQSFDPADDETPPTQVTYPMWVRPIKGLFDILGTVVGYREFDVSASFMIALPIFAAILIGDGGYGLLLTLGLGLLYPKLAGKMGKEFLQLMMVIGVTTTVWGFLANSFFGAPLPFYPFDKPIIPVNMTQPSMDFMMKLSFIIGAVHLSLAKLWQVIRLAPSLKALASLGWGMIVWGMLGVIQMFIFSTPLDWSTIWLWLLAVGAGLAILFDNPSRNLAKMIGMGIANFPLALLSAFSDVFSYVRLMAVGLASAVLAANFNEMAMGIPFFPATVLILILGHSLNLALCMIALFAHGVRLNMLEFSNNLGMQWTGQDYRPFSHRQHKETE